MNLIVNQEIDFYKSYFMGRKYREKSNNKHQTVSLLYEAKYFLIDLVFKAWNLSPEGHYYFSKLHINIKSKN